ncbi:YggS family pyridoxal phosphate-dependent enzyme [Pengzhenrongella frigida]|uniref:Pyridoxal phosphate homeostasis protein n=1 Tax=Pengzhenrongella frigida TaxID=1259133 RepID=A0A4Q5MWZ4_9MICO|nr:YggS family pyridoxal phosphate-dependent enzyme [Cellulomonas sp. HLT2-17]RYV50119.1 YggS family pyridoxal phosphate-dependent enzyme [Cellulomonas sp. HLT2-17]
MTDDDAHVAGIATRLGAVRARIAAAEHDAGRPAGAVRLLVATKTMPASLIRAAIGAGVDLIGENRVQELVAKGPELAGLGVEIHLIGHLQGNKANPALRWATCVQSVDSPEIAARLGERSAEAGRVLDVLIQVNVSGEPTKYGVLPDSATDFAGAVAGIPGLRLRGFMTIGANSPDAGLVRAGYAHLRELRDAVVGSGLAGTTDVTELSMGMSGDLELAIAEGATIVRVGTGVFGARPR